MAEQAQQSLLELDDESEALGWLGGLDDALGSELLGESDESESLDGESLDGDPLESDGGGGLLDDGGTLDELSLGGLDEELSELDDCELSLDDVLGGLLDELLDLQQQGMPTIATSANAPRVMSMSIIGYASQSVDAQVDPAPWKTAPLMPKQSLSVISWHSCWLNGGMQQAPASAGGSGGGAGALSQSAWRA